MMRIWFVFSSKKKKKEYGLCFIVLSPTLTPHSLRTTVGANFGVFFLVHKFETK